MPAVSKKQQRFFGYLLSNPDERKKRGISKKAAKDFAQSVDEALERQAKDRKKLSQPHSVSGSRRDHSHDVDSALTDHVPRKGKGRVRPASKKEIRRSAMRDAGISAEVAGKDHSIDLKKEETVLEWGWKDHKRAIEKRKIKKGKAVPYDAMLVKKKSETVAASHELKGDNLQELDRMGGPAALAGIVGAGIGLAKSGIDAVSKTAKTLQKTTKQKNNQLKMLEEVEGGVSVETYTNGIQFTDCLLYTSPSPRD